MALPAALFEFLAELKENNDRTWFQANKSRYEEQVKGPLLAFIGGFEERLGRLSGHFVADPRPVGGSLFRIYKDFTLTATLDQQAVTADDFPARLVQRWSHTTPFMRFVTEALALSF